MAVATAARRRGIFLWKTCVLAAAAMLSLTSTPLRTGVVTAAAAEVPPLRPHHARSGFLPLPDINKTTTDNDRDRDRDHEDRGHVLDRSPTATPSNALSTTPTSSLFSPPPRPPRRGLLLSIPPPPPEPVDAFSATVGTLAELRATMAAPDVMTLYLTQHVTLDGRELPAVERSLRILGACGGDGLAPCTLDADRASRHFTVGATGTLELHNLVVSNGNAVGKPWPDGGACFVYGKLTARGVTFANNTAGEEGGGGSSGGAVAVHYGAALFSDCAFRGNAAAADGGAVKAIGDVEFRGGSFEGNAAGAHGGGVFGDFGGVTVRDVAFVNATNTAREGDARDVYVGASGRAYLSPFVVVGGGRG